MKLKKFRAYLRGIYKDNDGWRTLNFSDQDEDCYVITDVYMDDDNDICLEAGDGCEMSAEEIYNQLRGYDGNSYIYVYAPEDDCNFEIEGGWYIDNDNDLTMDMHYHPDYDDDDYDDDDYDDDEDSFSIMKPYKVYECPKCGSSDIKSHYSWDTHMHLCTCCECGFKYACE